MKATRILIVVAVLVVIALVALYAFEVVLAPTAPAKSSTWSTAAGYPVQVGGAFGIAGQQCINSTSYVYCVGGQDANGGPRNEVYTSSAITQSSVNITTWTNTVSPAWHSQGTYTASEGRTMTGATMSLRAISRPWAVAGPSAHGVRLRHTQSRSTANPA